MKKWDLTKLYKGFSDLEFKNDSLKLIELIDNAVKKEELFLNYDNKKTKLIGFLESEIELATLADKLMHFASLTASVESTNMEAIKSMNTLQVQFSRLAKIETIFRKWLLNYPEVEEDIQANSFLVEHKFHIQEIIDHAKHSLDDKTESLIAKLNQNGSSAWERLQSLLTSTLTVDYDGKEITLSEVRNLATDANVDVRKRAYERS